MIQRYQCPPGKRIGMLIGHIFMHALCLGFIALMISACHLFSAFHIFGIILFGACYVFVVYLTIQLFVRGRIHETLLLSDRTLAILHPRRPTQFLKLGDIVAYRYDFGNFVLRDGTKFHFWLPHRERELAENLVARWYGDDRVTACFSRERVAYHLPKPMQIPAFLLFAGLLLAAIYFGVTERWLLLRGAAGTALGGLVAVRIWTAATLYRGACPLGDHGEDHESGGDSQPEPDGEITVTPNRTVQRFPRSRPRWLPYIGLYSALILFLALVVVPLNVQFTRYVPLKSGSWIIVAITALFVIPIVSYLCLSCYKLIFRGDLYTTVLLSSRTLAVVWPGKPTRYIKRGDCVAYQPGIQASSGRLVLRDGTRIGFGLAEGISEPPGPTMTIWRRWWPYVPEKKRIVTPIRGIIACYTGAIGVIFLLFGLDRESNAMRVLGLGLLLVVTIYCLFRIFRKKLYTVSLRPEDYPDKT